MRWASLHPFCLGLSVSWTCMSTSFTKLGKFSFIIFSNRFPISCSFSSRSGTPMMPMLDLLKLSRGHLYYPHFFRFFFLLEKSYFIVVQLHLSTFTPHHTPHPRPNAIPPLLPPASFCPCVLYSCS